MRALTCLGTCVAALLVASPISWGTAQAADCSAAKVAYHSSPSLPSASNYIECFEQPVEPSEGDGEVIWVPRNPQIGSGPQPGQPSFHQLETYLRWLQDSYGISEQDWLTAIQASRLPESYDVLVNDNVVIVPRNELPDVGTTQGVDPLQLERAQPGYLDRLKVEQLQNLDLGGFQ